MADWNTVRELALSFPEAEDPMGGWAGHAPSFAERYWVVLVEHRGHGRPANPAGFMTFEQIGDDVAALAQQLGLDSEIVGPQILDFLDRSS